MNFFQNVVFRSAAKVEWLGSRLQGKGYATSVPFEVKMAARFLATPPSLFVDVGGNVGDYSFEITRRFPSCDVFIFEPSPTNAAILRERFAGNGKVTIFERGLSDQETKLSLYTNAPGSGMASVHRRDVHVDALTETIRVIRFDEFWKDALSGRKIDLVKMDIEGHELRALSGFGRALDSVGMLQFEFGRCNLASSTNWRQLYEFFRSRKFVVYRYSPLGLQEISEYLETDEYYLHANFLAVNADAAR